MSTKSHQEGDQPQITMVGEWGSVVKMVDNQVVIMPEAWHLIAPSTTVRAQGLKGGEHL